LEKRTLPPRAKRGALMPGLILQAQEMEELFWLGMGYDSDDGERDESFAPSQESDPEDPSATPQEKGQNEDDTRKNRQKKMLS